MRQIFSIRFFAAVGAVFGLFVVLWAIFESREVIEGGGEPALTGPEFHAIDFVDQVFSSTDEAFDIVDGVADRDTQLVIDGSRRLTVTEGTPGEQLCPGFGEPMKCAVVADLLGEAVVWFALVPRNADGTVHLPAIDTLDDGVATLVNGWQFPYAPILDRRCPGDEYDFESYRALRDTLGDDFTSVYSVEARRLTAVVCGRRVPYAPVATSVPDSVPDDSTPSSVLSAPESDDD